MFQVTGLKIFGRVGIHVFLLLFFPETSEKNLGLHSKSRWVGLL